MRDPTTRWGPKLQRCQHCEREFFQRHPSITHCFAPECRTALKAIQNQRCRLKRLVGVRCPECGGPRPALRRICEGCAERRLAAVLMPGRCACGMRLCYGTDGNGVTTMWCPRCQVETVVPVLAPTSFHRYEGTERRLQELAGFVARAQRRIEEVA